MTRRQAEEVQGSLVAHHFQQQRSADGSQLEVTQTRHGLFGSMERMTDGFLKRTTLEPDSLALQRVVIVDSIARTQLEAESSSDLLVLHAASRATLRDDLSSNAGDHQHASLDNSDATVRVSGLTELKFVFERRAPTLQARADVSEALVSDHPGLPPIDSKPAPFRGERKAQQSWDDEVAIAETCYRDATTGARKVQCFQALSAAADKASNELVVEAYRARATRAVRLLRERESPEVVLEAEVDANRLLDAIVAARTKQEAANFLVATVVSNAVDACESSSVGMLQNAILVAHSLGAPDANVADNLLSVSLLDESSSLLVACTEEQLHESREMATLAFGTLARKTRDPTLQQRIQHQLLEAAERHPHRRSRSWGTRAHNVHHEYEYSTLLYALGNTGAPATDELQRRSETLLGETIEHPVLSVRVSSLNALRHHRSDQARDLVRSSALRVDQHDQFRRAAISAFLEQNADSLASSSATHIQRSTVLLLLKDMLRDPSSAPATAGARSDVVVDEWAEHPWANASVAATTHARGVVGQALSLLESLSLNFTLGMKSPLNYLNNIGTSTVGLTLSASANNYLKLNLNPLSSSMHLDAENHALVAANVLGTPFSLTLGLCNSARLLQVRLGSSSRPTLLWRPSFPSNSTCDCSRSLPTWKMVWNPSSMGRSSPRPRTRWSGSSIS
jgi:hypothetical protein